MGRTHAASGSLAFAAAAPLLPTLGVQLSAVGVVAASGAALLPDLDHPGSTAARALGPATGALARLVAAASGGHRQGTHSLVGVAPSPCSWRWPTQAEPPGGRSRPRCCSCWPQLACTYG